MNIYPKLAAIILLATVLIFPGRAIGQFLGFGNDSPEKTAEHLVHDRKWGMNAGLKAIEYGDRIIPLIKSESDDFRKLDNRNSFWIAEVLGSIDTELARNTSKELYGRKERLPKLVGAIGLSMHGADLGPINDGSFLVKSARENPKPPAGGVGLLDTDERELAIIALGYSKSDAALLFLHEILPQEDSYWLQRRICEALAQIKNPSSIPVFRRCLKNSEFSAIESAYRASICLGDKEATHLAIEWLSVDEKRKYNEEQLIDELQKVTGKWWNGRKKKDWQKWWEKEGEKWTIPEEFLVDWDKQPKMR